MIASWTRAQMPYQTSNSGAQNVDTATVVRLHYVTSSGPRDHDVNEHDAVARRAIHELSAMRGTLETGRGNPIHIYIYILY